MKVNELIKLLQESVEENPEVGDYSVRSWTSEYAEYIESIHVMERQRFVDLESE